LISQDGGPLEHFLNEHCKLELRSEDFIYVRITGTHASGAYSPTVRFSDGYEGRVGFGVKKMDKLGDHLWGRSSYATIPVDAKHRKALLDGSLSAEFRLDDVGSSTKMKINKLRFYILQKTEDSFEVVDISHLFSCTLDGIKTRCVSKAP